MSIVSVWDWDKLHYDYYEIPGSPNVGGFKRLDGLGIQKKRHDDGSMGIDVEDALPSLPKNARKIGDGIQARGTICVKRHGLPKRGLGDTHQAGRDLTLTSNPFIPALLGASTAFLVSRYIPKDKALLSLLFVFGLSTGLGIGMHHSKYMHAHDK
jgi:hypothetical protein